jgi:hypothetical protein
MCDHLKSQGQVRSRVYSVIEGAFPVGIHCLLLYPLLAISLGAQNSPSGGKEDLGAAVTLQADLAPIKTTYHELFAIVSKTRAIVLSANVGSDSKRTTEELRLGDGRVTLTLRNGFSEDALAGGPEVTHDVYYNYRNAGAAIAEVNIRLGDLSRTVSVSGQSREHVQALHGLLTQELAGYGTVLGGIGFRFGGAACLIFVGGGAIMLGAIVAQRWAIRGMLLVLLLAMELSVLVLPWPNWFPGTAVYQHDASFLVRHAAGISCASLLATILVPAAGVAYSKYFRRWTAKPIEAQPATTKRVRRSRTKGTT